MLDFLKGGGGIMEEILLNWGDVNKMTAHVNSAHAVCTGTTKRLHVFNSKNKCQKEIIMAQKFYCKWCGSNYSSVSSLTSGHCSRNPEGKYHELYEGAEKSQYTCKFCGAKYSSLSSLTSGSCSKSPYKKHHPAL